ncbi:MAG: hypothetical protein K2H35_00775 [Muribaculaceae bacterium]|nr:hypothetical protein [Muribaculaceae bacterium]
MVNYFQTSKIFRHALAAVAPLAVVLLGACNSKDDPKEGIDYQAAQSVAVTKFAISPNARVMENLDSVYFSIDLEHRVIYNADSLPMGTRIDKLVPVITYPATVGSAEITMTGGTTRTGTVNYITNPSDSIDFTGNVSLKLTSIDGSLTASYRLKVNVHKCQGDSLMWDKEALAPLPSRNGSPKVQRTVSAGDKVYTLLQESNGGYTLSSCLDPNDNNWQKQALNLPFTPRVRSLNPVNSDLYILDTDNILHKSADGGNSWNSCNVEWINIIGEFNDTLLGISTLNGDPAFDIYPRPQGFQPYALPADFPIENFSNFNSFITKWAESAIGLFSGGDRNGLLNPHTWAYDGENWAKISDRPLPALQNAVIIPYFSYRKTTASWIQTEYSVWLCLGGELADGKINNTVYISYDNGVTWRPAEEHLQTPSFVHPGVSADYVIRSTPMQSDLNDSWKKAPASRRAPQLRLSYEIDGDNIDWECPYIYLFGGSADGTTTNDIIRRAVLARLTFTPLF